MIGLLAVVVAAVPIRNEGLSAASPPDGTAQIVGGTEADPGAFPYTVGVVDRFFGEFLPGRPPWGAICGGSVVHPEWVLTAAHCVDGSLESHVAVVADTTNLNVDGQLIAVDDIAVHPSYNEDTLEFDLALLGLSEPTRTPTVPLLRSTDPDLGAPGFVGTATGWGRIADGGPASVAALREVDLPLLSDALCGGLLGSWGYVSGVMLCAGDAIDGGIDTCQGDSGGPLTVSDDHGPVMVGITSWGISCAAPSLPGAYTKVSAVETWIAGWIGRPGNNDFADSRSPECGVGADVIDSNFATVENLEPDPIAGGSDASLWWTITAPVDATLYVTSLGSDFEAEVALYEGSTLGSLTELAVSTGRPVASGGEGSYNGHAVQVPVQADDSIHVRLSGAVTSLTPARGSARLAWSLDPTSSAQFPDVPQGSLFRAEIATMANRAVISGLTTCQFGGDQSVTRQTMAAFFHRMAGAPTEWVPQAGFSDVEPGDLFTPEISWMADADIAFGFLDGTFKPTAQVSRQAMAAYFYRLAGSPSFSPPGTPTFDDVDSSSGFYLEIEWMVDEGVAGGFDDGGFHPTDSISRQAMAAMMDRFFDADLVEI